jgi:hypothetical protein
MGRGARREYPEAGQRRRKILNQHDFIDFHLPIAKFKV